MRSPPSDYPAKAGKDGQKTISSWTLYNALLSGWDPNKPEETPGLLKTIKNRLAAMTIGRLERHRSLLPAENGRQQPEMVDRTEHCAELAFLLVAKYRGQRIPVMGVLEDDSAAPSSGETWQEKIDHPGKSFSSVRR